MHYGSTSKHFLFIDAKSIDDIADTLGLPKQAVRSQYLQIVKMIRGNEQEARKTVDFLVDVKGFFNKPISGKLLYM